MADNCCGTEALFSEDRTYVYPGDEYAVEKHNLSAAEDNRLMTMAFPYPFQGNPLTAKVVILSLNAGYVKRVNDYFAKILRQIPPLAMGVCDFMRQNLRLEAESFMPPADSRDIHPDLRDVCNMYGDWYWYDSLTKLRCDNLSEERIFSGTALIQSLPYASTRAGNLPHGRLMPSQVFTWKLISHIAATRDTIFVVPRARDIWKKLLKSTWTRLENEDRLVFTKNPRCQSLSTNNLSPADYSRLTERLKS